MIDEYLRWAVTTGASFVPSWSNASVALLALAIFSVLFVVGAFSQVQWLFDAAFLSLVAGGILVSWPAMAVLSVAAVLVTVILSFLHRALAPKQNARIQAEADRRANAAVGEFARELPGGEDALRAMRDAERKS